MKIMYKALALLLLVVQFSSFANDKTQDQLEVEAVVQQYIDGTSKGNPSLIEDAFHSEASLILSHPKKPFWQVSVKEFARWFESSKTTRSGYILSVTLDGDIATARALITVAKPVKKYVDQFLLKRFAKGWQIISKSATQIDTQQKQAQLESAMNKRVLFIASSADQHGKSTLPTGTSFSELVEAYEVFIDSGYQVDVVSTQGGKLPLAYINTSDLKHKQYIYNQDFMYLLANTLSPEQVDASQYLAVHYVGGGNAMYQVAENKTLQAIAMQVYEKNHGIVSSVCHGTAGIVNLKLSNGKYLVSGRKISGYPTEFEKTDANYYQQFPFDIEETIKQRGGKFFYGERNQPYVQIDGRLITGTNYQSSKGVALAMVAEMNKMKRLGTL
ncbi:MULTISPECIES: nuclear transport factor 2 family protein [Pseudoalteromonas]|nr:MULTISPECIES: nuclear transport factor 2 family protein [Pseudoalteromonas]MDP5215546.1 nuclear transport factor 2 family protein [Pseudoalteromonas tunicata]